MTVKAKGRLRTRIAATVRARDRVKHAHPHAGSAAGKDACPDVVWVGNMGHLLQKRASRQREVNPLSGPWPLAAERAPQRVYFPWPRRRTPRMLLRGSDLHLRPNSCGGRGPRLVFLLRAGRAGCALRPLHTGPLGLALWVAQAPAHRRGPLGRAGIPPKYSQGTQLSPASSVCSGRSCRCPSGTRRRRVCLGLGAGRRITLSGPSGSMLSIRF